MPRHITTMGMSRRRHTHAPVCRAHPRVCDNRPRPRASNMTCPRAIFNIEIGYSCWSWYMPDRVDLEALVRRLGDPATEVRVSARDALIAAGPEAIPLLVAALQDQHSPVGTGVAA